MFKIIIFVIILFFGVGVWESISMSYGRSKYERKRKEEAERAAAEARTQYPKIENWISHPLYKAATVFLVNRIDKNIQKARTIPVGRGGGLSLDVAVGATCIYIGGDWLDEDFFYYSNQGYDRIKVGYYVEETSEACKDFATALSKYLAVHYESLNINIGNNVYIKESSCAGAGAAEFWISLIGVQPKLKQV